jgi:hypothetical protein
MAVERDATPGVLVGGSGSGGGGEVELGLVMQIFLRIFDT